MLTPRTELLIDLALEEDLGLGDLTSRALFSPGHRRRGWIEARQDLVVCGVEIAARVFARVDPALRVRLLATDGDRLRPGARVLEVAGPTAALLAAERSALNFLQRLSGIATHVRTHVDLLQGTGVRLADTRKTTPGWRALEKHAVRCGGGANH
ncbi:MAG: nicotinate-nucleotide diphosphorylase (carboxylating), partial [Verrucomicrobia bacterium]|nr:nicotinate-nucleotide diphosphorylase (carboxylating) [Verrucomicrobiota bacterium]